MEVRAGVEPTCTDLQFCMRQISVTGAPCRSHEAWAHCVSIQSMAGMDHIELDRILPISCPQLGAHRSIPCLHAVFGDAECQKKHGCRQRLPRATKASGCGWRKARCCSLRCATTSTRGCGGQHPSQITRWSAGSPLNEPRQADGRQGSAVHPVRPLRAPHPRTEYGVVSASALGPGACPCAAGLQLLGARGWRGR